MTLITVKRFRVRPASYEIYTIDSTVLGEKWCSFFLKTNFCRLLPYTRDVNRTVRRGYNGYVYVVSANDREIVYNSNYILNSTDEDKYILAKQLVEYILSRYKYGYDVTF